jgi:hypothetical protein
MQWPWLYGRLLPFSLTPQVQYRTHGVRCATVALPLELALVLTVVRCFLDGPAGQ